MDNAKNLKFQPKGWDRSGLPGWTYHSSALLDLEIEICKTNWQVASHISDIPNIGDFKTFDLCGERAIILRDTNFEIKAFHNICRHRGSRLGTNDQGKCKNGLICPFHGWVYNLDGTLRGASQPKSFTPLDKNPFSLRPVEYELWHGFVFVRFQHGHHPSVKELVNTYEREESGYQLYHQIHTEEY